MSDDHLILSATTLSNALGHGRTATLAALRSRQSGLRRCDFDSAGLDTWIGRVDAVEQVNLPLRLSQFDCRNNRLALLGLEQDGFSDEVARCLLTYGAGRIGLFLGTSTSGVHQTEQAYRQISDGRLPADFDLPHTHLIYSVVDFVRTLFGLQGPSLSISTACSSSAKVFATAHRSVHAGLCDAALVGGVDSLCLTTLFGFNALQVVSSQPCRPWDRERDGINIGEAAGFALLERASADRVGPLLLGFGESSDAHHIATPHPQGAGAALAMQRALQMASLDADAIDYINLHGTATPSNDASEDAALRSVFDSPPPFSSTKGWTGHTLGAAGISEAIMACQAIEEGFIPGTLNTECPDPALSDALLTENRDQAVRHVMSNSFGFGGSNCCLLFGEAPV